MKRSNSATILRLVFLCLWATCVACHATLPGVASGDEPTEPTAHPVSSEQLVDYSIIVTGNELLSGVYADGHTLYLTKTLRPLGLRCVGSVSVDDQAEDIRQALQYTLPRSQLVIVTGGLGPTKSDITRDVLATFTGIKLHEHPEVMQEMERRFSTTRDQLRDNLRRQALVPIRGTYLTNRTGTAVGLVFEYQDKIIVALPGPPRELQPMVRDSLIPYLAKRFGVHTLGCALTVRFVGLGQSQIDQTMKEHIQLPDDVMQTSQFTAGRVDFTFSLPGDSASDRQRLEQLRVDLHKTMEDHIYADDATTTLEAAAIQQLDAQSHTVVLVEMGSAGTLAAGFASAPRGRNVLAGALVAADETQLQRLLQIPADRWSAAPPPTRLQLIAKTAQDRVQSDWAIVVGAPKKVAESSDWEVQVLITTPRGEPVQRSFPWRDSSPASLTRFSTQFFNYLRRVGISHTPPLPHTPSPSHAPSKIG